MSTATLSSLRDYLTGTLSSADMIWLIEEMKDFMKRPEERLEPKAMEEKLQREKAFFDERSGEADYPDMHKELYTPEEAYELTMKDIKAIYDKKYAV